MNKFPFILQQTSTDCGPTCLLMICAYYDKHSSIEKLRKISGHNVHGASLFGISEAAEKLGFNSRCVKLSFTDLIQCPLPSILPWSKSHFVVLTPDSNEDSLIIADPMCGKIKLTRNEFCEKWTTMTNYEENFGIALLLIPISTF